MTMYRSEEQPMKCNSSSATQTPPLPPGPGVSAEGRGDLPMTAPISSNLALYQIEQRLAELLELRNIAAEDGDTEALEAIDKQFEEYFLREVKKIDGICHALHAFEQAACAAEIEATRMKNRANYLMAQRDRIKAATLKAMQDHGVRVLETPTNKLRVQANGGLEPMEVSGIEELPSELLTVIARVPESVWVDVLEITEAFGDYATYSVLEKASAIAKTEPNSEAIRQALKRGEEVPGAKLLPRGVHLRIE
jgi:hypothetical protein